jgi:hypothetical protein
LVIPVIPIKSRQQGYNGYNNRTVYGETSELVYTITVPNAPKFLLPDAGGRGVGTIMVIGALAVLAGVMIGIKRK